MCSWQIINCLLALHPVPLLNGRFFGLVLVLNFMRFCFSAIGLFIQEALAHTWTLSVSLQQF